MSAANWTGADPEFILRLEECGALAEAEHLFNLQEQAALTGDDSELRAWLGRPISAEEFFRRIDEVLQDRPASQGDGLNTSNKKPQEASE